MHANKRNADEKHRVGDRLDSASLPPKTPQADDPMQLKAGLLEGNPQAMLEGLIEEYARMGWNADQIARLFEQPFFAATHGLTRRFGREAIRACIDQTLQRCGVFRFDTTESQPVVESPACLNIAKHRP